MPVDELKELGLKLKAARKEKGLTQQELADISHVSTKQIANIERGKMNPSYLILKALAKVVPLSLDSLLAPEISPDDEGANKMKILYMNCPPEMRETLLHQTQGLSENFLRNLKKSKPASENATFLRWLFSFPEESGKQCPRIATAPWRCLLRDTPKPPLNAEFHSAAARSTNAFDHDQLIAGRGLFPFRHHVPPPYLECDPHLP